MHRLKVEFEVESIRRKSDNNVPKTGVNNLERSEDQGFGKDSH